MKVNESVTLLCDYELAGAELYSVKWSHDDQGFYRFFPRLQDRVLHLDVEVRSEELLAPALLCHKEPARASKAPLLGPFRAWKPPIPYAIKNQRGASRDPLGLCVPKPLVGGFGCPRWFFMA